MKSFSLSVILLLLVGSIPKTINAGNISPKSVSYLQAKQLAAEQNKTYILYFTADWCLPCQWMSEQTLNNDQVVAKLENDHYLVKLDIETFEGQVLKDYFSVSTLPTFLKFSSDHELIEKRDESMSTTAFIQFLENELHTTNKDVLIKETKTNTSIVPVEKPQPNMPVVSEQTEQETKKEDQNTFAFGVQVGAFSSEANGIRRLNEVKEYAIESAFLKTEVKDSRIIYKVIIGKMPNESDAKSIKDQLNLYGIKGFVTKINTTDSI